MGGILSKPKAPPKPEPVEPIPQPDDLEIQKSKQREAGRSRRRTGRASTVLTNGGQGGQGLGG